MMKPDPIVEEVRQIRDDYASQFNYDLNAIYENLKKQELQNTKPHHRFSPKRIVTLITTRD